MPQIQPILRHAAAALGTGYAAYPPLAALTQALRAPLLPVIGFAELMARAESQAQTRAWAAEIVDGSRQLLAVLDCTLALVAGRCPPEAAPDTLAAATQAVAALRCMLAASASGESAPALV